MNGKVSVVFNRNCFSENERHSRVQPPLEAVHRKTGGVKEMVQDRHDVTTHH